MTPTTTAQTITDNQAARSLPARLFCPDGFFPLQETKKGTRDMIKDNDFASFIALKIVQFHEYCQS
jgi:hypothetical protein